MGRRAVSRLANLLRALADRIDGRADFPPMGDALSHDEIVALFGPTTFADLNRHADSERNAAIARGFARAARPDLTDEQFERAVGNVVPVSFGRGYAEEVEAIRREQARLVDIETTFPKAGA